MENRALAVDVNCALSVYQSRDVIDDKPRQYDKMMAFCINDTQEKDELNHSSINMNV